jgi:hypothetical protein
MQEIDVDRDREPRAAFELGVLAERVQRDQ